MLLYEKYRPKTFDDVLGQDKAVKEIRAVMQSGWGGKAYWISGCSGTGKTTLARIIANQGADDFFVSEYDCADNVNMAAMDDIERSMYLSAGLFGSGKRGRVYLINEAHGLRKNIIRKFLGILERIPRHVVFIFTTTKLGQADLFEDQIDANPLLSRCICIELTNQGLSRLFAARAKEIAGLENLDGKPISTYENLVKKERNNMRAVLQAVSRGVMKR